MDLKIPVIENHSYPMEYFEIPEKKPQQGRSSRNQGKKPVSKKPNTSKSTNRRRF
jgi:ATP-dependent RNA helicase RhlE